MRQRNETRCEVADPVALVYGDAYAQGIRGGEPAGADAGHDDREPGPGRALMSQPDQSGRAEGTARSSRRVTHDPTTHSA